jgi:pimeloyl-ACP methyl ester carboxylesterase
MDEITGRYTNIDDVRIYFESCGSGSPVLLIHTAGRDNRQWHGVMELLAPHYRVFAPDLPGHGKSWPLTGNACLQDAHAIADWLHRFASSVIREKYAVMGCSLGGNLTLLMAASYDEVHAAIALEGADYTPTFPEVALDLMTHPQISLMHYNMDFSMSLVGDEATAAGRSFSEWGVLSLVPAAQQGDLRAYTRCDIRNLMTRVRCPVLIVRGTADWLVSQEMVEATRGRLVNARVAKLELLPGIGHFPHLEDPGRVAQLALDFLAESY